MRARLFRLFFVLVFCSLATAETLNVIYPSELGRDKENSYDYQLLKLALDKSGVPYSLSLTQMEMNEERARRMIMIGAEEVTIMSAGTQADFEEKLQAIYIPLYGGLIGNRIFIIHKDLLEAFSQVKNLTDLRQFTAGQGPTWPDVAVFKNAELPLMTEEYPNLFTLTEYKRIDYFPRGANEPFVELERFKEEYPNLVVEPSVSLVYPFAVYYFVSKENKALHDAVYHGLIKAHEDGSFIEFFRTHPATRKMLDNAHMQNRVRITINNPTMSDRTLSIPSQYWFDSSWQ
ncbi:hypothetical protein [Reinekea sp. G2M2-21]|uniref:hypothetical protein n=1 Tax=Reinekea sp. G2M2-21 TaxID=2788942 RepID=UPI0018A90DCD|nr:hypothetical protein [Reinekea sp. G2M2-21]